MTYGLHIILRYEIEQALFDEKMDVSEIPHVWNDKFEEYLGIEPQSDTDGALQDVQWAWAMWGYFPNYVLGNLYAAMMREKMCSDIPEWLSQVAEGNVTIPVQWLIDNVHRKSNLYDPAEMIKNITGKSLTVDPFIKYLDEKYSALFG
jgi:carboxypeptidase Taq